MDNLKKALIITFSCLAALVVAVVLSSIFGFSGRSAFQILVFVVPLAVLVCGLYWSSRSSLLQVIISAVYLVFTVFFIYGFFSGSYSLSKDTVLLLFLCIAPFLLGAMLPKVLHRLISK